MIEKSIPVLVFFLMFIIGASLKGEDFRRLQSQPTIILMATFVQVLLLPLLAWLLIVSIKPGPMVAGGLFLVSICPGGAVSNVYTFLAKANVALSVTLTTLNSLLATVILPIVVAYVFPLLFDIDAQADGLIQQQSLQLSLLLLCPVVVGMILRHIMPGVIDRVMPLLERIGALGLLSLLVAIFIQFQQQIFGQPQSLIVLAVLFTIGSLLLAWCVCFCVKAKTEDMAAVLIEFPVRNLALTALIAVSIFQNTEYLLFAAVFFVVQTPIMLAMVFWYRANLKEVNI
jgi:BASS family bile acid:Na+ symporter